MKERLVAAYRRVLAMVRRVRYNQLLFVGITVVTAIAFRLAYQLRFDFDVPRYYARQCFVLLPYVALAKPVLFFLFRGHSTEWRYVGFRDMLFLVVFSTFCSVLLLAFSLIHSSLHIPRGVICIDWLLSLVLIGGVRLSARFIREEVIQRVRSVMEGEGARTVIIGAGDEGEMLVREIRRDPGSGYRVVAFFDDDPSKKGKSLHGVRVEGPVEDVKDFVRHTPVDTAIVAMPGADRSQIMRIRDIFRDLNIPVKTLPRLHEIIEHSPALDQLREISITDLLGREEIRIDSDQVRELIEGKSVLVTGAGGSIGSELCFQIMKRRPDRLVLMERAENSLFHIHRKLTSLQVRGRRAIVAPVLCDIKDEASVLRELTRHRPSLVFHAAAHKHVAMQELNPVECFNNNVKGMRNLARACVKAGVERFTLISSDKAVNPSSVMGATKRVCEMYALAANQLGRTEFLAVRFGNVLASEGSVVPIFLDQIARGGPVTVTHPDVKRYFMTVSEAVTLLLQAAALGESGRILILDMGEPVKIVDLARQLITLAGKSVEEIPIEFTGLKPGEKLFEELKADDETYLPTAHEKIKCVDQTIPDPDAVLAAIDHAIAELASPSDEKDVREILRRLVPHYMHTVDNLTGFTGESQHDLSVSGSFRILPI